MKSTPLWLWLTGRWTWLQRAWRRLQRAWRANRAGLVVGALILAALGALVVMVFVLPHVTNAGVKELVTPVVQLALGIGVGWAAYVGWRQRQEQLVSERFTKAVVMLGDTGTGVRIGGIHALGMLLRDTPSRQPEVVELLCAFVRQQSAVRVRNEPIGDDIVAALSEIGRRNAEDDQLVVVNLSYADVKGTRFYLGQVKKGRGAEVARLDASDEGVIIVVNPDEAPESPRG